MKPASITNITEFRNAKQIREEIVAKKMAALRKVTENKQSDSAKFNYDFYCLVDLFLKEKMPDYAWRFDVWLEEIEKK